MKKLLLRASLHNWGMTILIHGDWKSTTWNIYDDGTYRIDTENGIVMSDRESYELLLKNPNTKFTKIKYSYGRMSPVRFDQLKEAIDRDPWIDPEIETTACDGVAWEITQYSPNGNVVRTNNGPVYIYGHRNMEQIVACLPGRNRSYGSSAYISVKMKRKTK